MLGLGGKALAGWRRHRIPTSLTIERLTKRRDAFNLPPRLLHFRQPHRHDLAEDATPVDPSPSAGSKRAAKLPRRPNKVPDLLACGLCPLGLAPVNIPAMSRPAWRSGLGPMHSADELAPHRRRTTSDAAALALGCAARGRMGALHGINRHFLRHPRPSPHG